MPNKVLINRGSSDSAMESTKKTLDDLGIPPPPPSSSSSDSNLKAEQGTIETNEDVELAPINEHVYDTSEPSMPVDYEDRLEAINPKFHADNRIVPEKLQAPTKIPTDMQTKKTMQNLNRIVIAKDLSKKALDKLAKVDERTKTSLKDMKEKQRSFEKKLAADMKEVKTEHKDILKAFNKIVGENESILAENNEFAKDIHTMIEKYKELLAQQEKNNAFIEKFYSYLDPLVEREKKIIADNAKIAKEALTIHEQFKTVIAYYDKQDSINERHGSYIDTIKEDIANLKHAATELPKLFSIAERAAKTGEEALARAKDLERLKLDHRLDAFEKRVDTRLDELEKEITATSKAATKATSETEKYAAKLGLLRERLDAYKKRKE